MQGRLRRTVLGGNQKDFLGCNATAYSYYADETGAPMTILVDFGISLLSRRQVERGFHTLLPDASDYLFKKDDPDHTPSRPASALFITHGHNDHIGAIVHYMNMGYKIPPIYTAPLTRKLIEDELRYYGFAQSDWPQFHDIAPGDKINIGPYEVEPFSVSHSIPSSYGFALRAGGETFVESGDLKAALDIFLGPGTDFVRLKELAHEGVKALFLDGTKALSADANETNAQMLADFEKMLGKHPDQRMIVTFYGGYIETMALMLTAAAETGRAVVIGEGSVRRFFNALVSSGFDIVSEIQSRTGKPLHIVDGFDPSWQDTYPQALVLTGGSDAHQYGAIAKAADGKSEWLKFDPLDVIFLNAFTLPGQSGEFDKLCAKIKQSGATLYTRHDLYIHGNGHGSLPELLEITDAARPQYVVPIYCLEIMANSLIAKLDDQKQRTIRIRDGDSIDFTESGAAVVPRAQDREKIIGVRFDPAQKRIIYTLDIDGGDGENLQTRVKEFKPRKDNDMSRKPLARKGLAA